MSSCTPGSGLVGEPGEQRKPCSRRRHAGLASVSKGGRGAVESGHAEPRKE